MSAPSTIEPPFIAIDWPRFDPTKIQPLTHRFADHPLLQPAALVELGKRLEAQGRVRSHTNATEAGTSFSNAPALHPNPKSAEETLKDVANAGAWMSLLNVQTDDVYRGLVDQALDSVKPRIDTVDPGMCFRGGWIFVTSPNTVTPFHMDTENGLLVHVRGRKRLYVWDPADTAVVSDRGRELFHAKHSRELVVWNEEFRQRARVFDLEPGQGAYIPVTGPHLVENGPEPSITVSFTYYTDRTRKLALLYKARARLRAIGIDPPPIGAVPLLDDALHAVTAQLRRAENTLRRALGKRTLRPTDAPYAIARYS